MADHFARSVDHLPYSFGHLDELMEAAGMDVLLITSEHKSNTYWADISSCFSRLWMPSVTADTWVLSDKIEQVSARPA